MSKPSSTLSDKLLKRFRALDVTRANIDRLHYNNLLSQTAKSRMYEGLFLSAHVSFEGFIEELFFGLLIDGQGVRSSRRDIIPRISVKSHIIAREVVIGVGKKYVDWLPYDKTDQLSKLYFRGGRPFSDISNPNKDTLKKCSLIRNVIAHKSRHSIKQFEKGVIGSTPLLPRESSAAGYLQGFLRIAPAQTRFSNLLSQLSLIARDLSR